MAREIRRGWGGEGMYIGRMRARLPCVHGETAGLEDPEGEGS